MSSNDMLYCHPSDDLLSSATITLTDGTLDSAYALSDLFSGNPGRGVRFTTDHLRLVFDHGSAKPIQFFSPIHTNIRSTATVHLEANATNSWGSPSLSQAITMTDAGLDGLRANVPVDLRAVAGAGNYRYSSLHITGNGVNIVLSHLCLSQALRSMALLRESPKVMPANKTTVLTTNADVEMRLQRAVTRYRLDAEGAADADRAALLAWQADAAGMARPFPIVWDPAVNVCWFVRFATDSPFTHAQAGPDRLPLNLSPSWIEVSRGQVWP